MIWDEETKKIREEYKEKFKKNPPGINYDEYDSIEDYRKYLKKLINEGKSD